MEDAAKPSGDEIAFQGVAFKLSAFLVMPLLIAFIQVRGMFQIPTALTILILVALAALVVLAALKPRRSEYVFADETLTARPPFPAFLYGGKKSIRWTEVTAAHLGGWERMPHVMLLAKSQVERRGMTTEKQHSVMIPPQIVQGAGFLDGLLARLPSEATLMQSEAQRLRSPARFPGLERLVCGAFFALYVAAVSLLLVDKFPFQTFIRTEELFRALNIAVILGMGAGVAAAWRAKRDAFPAFVAGGMIASGVGGVYMGIYDSGLSYAVFLAVMGAALAFGVYGLGKTLFEKRWKTFRIPVALLALACFAVAPAYERLNGRSPREIEKLNTRLSTNPWTPDSEEFLVSENGKQPCSLAVWYSDRGEALRRSELGGVICAQMMGKEGAALVVKQPGPQNSPRTLWFLPRNETAPKKLIEAEEICLRWRQADVRSPDGERSLILALEKKGAASPYILDLRDGALHKLEMAPIPLPINAFAWGQDDKLRFLSGSKAWPSLAYSSKKFLGWVEKGAPFSVIEYDLASGAVRTPYKDVAVWVDYEPSPGMDAIYAARLISENPYKTEAFLIDVAASPASEKILSVEPSQAIWSLDGGGLLLLSGKGDLCRADAGSQPKRILSGVAGAQWLPDGERFLAQTRAGSLVICDIGSGQARKLWRGMGANLDEIEPSGDGKWVATIKRGVFSGDAMVLFSTDGRERFWLRRRIASRWNWSWAPDGKALICQQLVSVKSGLDSEAKEEIHTRLLRLP